MYHLICKLISKSTDFSKKLNFHSKMEICWVNGLLSDSKIGKFIKYASNPKSNEKIDLKVYKPGKNMSY